MSDDSNKASGNRGSGGRGRGKRGGRPAVPPEEVEANLALFASYVKDDRAKAKAARKAEQQARKEADAARKVVDDKDAAAARLKAIRSRSGVSAEERSEAEEAYRRALAAVVAAETGEAPAWAPETEPEPETADNPEGAEPSPSENGAADESPVEVADGESDEGPTDDAPPEGEGSAG